MKMTSLILLGSTSRKLILYGLMCWVHVNVFACDPSIPGEPALSAFDEQSHQIAEQIATIEDGRCNSNTDSAAESCLVALGTLNDQLQPLVRQSKQFKNSIECSTKAERDVAAGLEQEIGSLNDQVRNADQQTQSRNAGITAQESILASVTEEIQNLLQGQENDTKELEDLNRIGNELRQYAWVPFYGLHLLVTYGQHGGDETAQRLASQIAQRQGEIEHKQRILEEATTAITQLRREQGDLDNSKHAMLEQLARMYQALESIRSQGSVSLATLSTMLNYTEGLSARLAEYRDAHDFKAVTLAFDTSEHDRESGHGKQSSILTEMTAGTLDKLRGYRQAKIDNCTSLAGIPTAGLNTTSAQLLQAVQGDICRMQ